jgi:hypothetical protein
VTRLIGPALLGRLIGRVAPLRGAPMMATQQQTVLITGNTYPVRSQLKLLGGRWDAEARGWRVPQAKADEARRIVASGADQQPTRAKKCRKCGATAIIRRGHVELRILPNGLCSDCDDDRRHQA